MSNPQDEIKNIYQKTLRLLNDSNSRLHSTKRILKKAVIRLGLISNNNDRQVNKILEDIKLTVGGNFNLNNLDKKLDDLFVLINNSEHNHKPETITGFYSYLSSAFEEFVGKDVSDKHLANIKSLIDKRLPDDELSIEFLHTIKNLSENCNGLQSFIFKINRQLSDVEHYVRQNQLNFEEGVERSCELQKMVDVSVNSIEQEVASADNIDTLKSSISNYLDEIKNKVEENKFAEEEKEKLSLKKFTNMMDELTSAQKETYSLKEELYESKSQLLRDALTGIPNRLAYDERMETEYNRMRRKKTSLCIAIWDIDFFKNVNDVYGHFAGDKVLQHFSKVINKRTRKVDLFARIGGEEFILVMPDTAIDNAFLLNDKLRKIIEKCNFHNNGENFPITASVGIAEFQEGDSIETVYKKADEALYQSKGGGRNMCTIYFEENIQCAMASVG